LQASQELATILLNYHIGRIVLGSMCVGDSVWLGWSGIRVAGPTQVAKGLRLQTDTCKRLIAHLNAYLANVRSTVSKASKISL